MVDLHPVIQAALGLAVLAITTLGGLALQAVATKLKLQISAQQTAAFDDALNKALSLGVANSSALIAAKGWDHIDVHNQVVELALNSIVGRFPDALKGVGLSANLSDPQNVDTITSALKRSLPAAFTAAASSPATPPAPNSPPPPVPVTVVGTVP